MKKKTKLQKEIEYYCEMYDNMKSSIQSILNDGGEIKGFNLGSSYNWIWIKYKSKEHISGKFTQLCYTKTYNDLEKERLQILIKDRNEKIDKFLAA